MIIVIKKITGFVIVVKIVFGVILNVFVANGSIVFGLVIFHVV